MMPSSKLENRIQTFAAFAMLMIYGTVSCKPIAPNESEAKYILGKNDIEVVSAAIEAEIPEHILNATVLLEIPLIGDHVRFCTGVLAPADKNVEGSTLRILSNAHCFDKDEELAKVSATPQDPRDLCKSIRVHFGIHGNMTRVSSRRCLEQSLRLNQDGDLSTFALDANPPSHHTAVEIYPDANNLAGRELIMVHHPALDRNKVFVRSIGYKVPAAVVTRDTCTSQGLFAFKDWPLNASFPNGTQHTCDLTNGSSGSGLFDLLTGKLVGVNWGGVTISSGKISQQINVATRPDLVQAFLLGNEAGFQKREINPQLLAARNAAKKKENDLKLKCGTVSNANQGSSNAQNWLTLLVLILPALLPISLQNQYSLSAKK